MDNIFKETDVVEALDTSAGVWRTAVVRQISCLSVTVIFPEFSAHNCKTTEDISKELVNYPSKWPIRSAHKKHEPELQARRQRGGNKLAPEKAANKVIADKVSNMMTQNIIKTFFAKYIFWKIIWRVIAKSIEFNCQRQQSVNQLLFYDVIQIIFFQCKKYSVNSILETKTGLFTGEKMLIENVDFN